MCIFNFISFQRARKGFSKLDIIFKQLFEPLSPSLEVYRLPKNLPFVVKRLNCLFLPYTFLFCLHSVPREQRSQQLSETSFCFSNLLTGITVGLTLSIHTQAVKVNTQWKRELLITSKYLCKLNSNRSFIISSLEDQKIRDQLVLIKQWTSTK